MTHVSTDKESTFTIKEITIVSQYGMRTARISPSPNLYIWLIIVKFTLRITVVLINSFVYFIKCKEKFPVKVKKITECYNDHRKAQWIILNQDLNLNECEMASHRPISWNSNAFNYLLDRDELYFKLHCSVAQCFCDSSAAVIYRTISNFVQLSTRKGIFFYLQ